jgi:hypothetical protein
MFQIRHSDLIRDVRKCDWKDSNTGILESVPCDNLAWAFQTT